MWKHGDAADEDSVLFDDLVIVWQVVEGAPEYDGMEYRLDIGAAHTPIAEDGEWHEWLFCVALFVVDEGDKSVEAEEHWDDKAPILPFKEDIANSDRNEQRRYRSGEECGSKPIDSEELLKPTSWDGRLREVDLKQDRSNYDERNVDPEDPTPGHELCKDTTNEWSNNSPNGPHRAEDTKPLTTLVERH